MTKLLDYLEKKIICFFLMPSTESPPTEIGRPIPANTPHAISVTLPTWRDNVDYEEAADRVVSRMKSGYPRFFIHPQIKKVSYIYIIYIYSFFLKKKDYI
jgi:hypothetical protein